MFQAKPITTAQQLANALENLRFDHFDRRLVVARRDSKSVTITDRDAGMNAHEFKQLVAFLERRGLTGVWGWSGTVDAEVAMIDRNPHRVMTPLPVWF